jgi:hypothetical protein
MKARNIIFLIAAVGGALLIASCSHILSSEMSLPSSHPEALGAGRVDCSECHQDQQKGTMRAYERFSHSPLFVKNHRYYASEDGYVCSTCHQVSFCNDCHVNKVEMKPSIRYGYRPDREMPHRGDFMTLHKIEGKIDPASCYRCHGRSNNEKCIGCHR